MDCNDVGAEYMEACLDNTRLVDVVEGSRIEDLERYVPIMPRGGRDVPLAVQVNFFDCGGIAVGVCMSHQLADANSLVMFVNRWASVCRDDCKTISLSQPILELTSRFPPVNFSQHPSPPPPPPTRMDVPQKVITKRYTFDKKILINRPKGGIIWTGLGEPYTGRGHFGFSMEASYRDSDKS